MCVRCSCLQTLQKRASALLTDGYESPCGWWELNSEPLEEQSVLLTAEPSLQALLLIFKVSFCAAQAELQILLFLLLGC